MANTGTDIGALTEALNDKMDRDVQNRATGVQTVIETWHDGTEWYRLWSDGWCEQGGQVSLTYGAGTQVNFRKIFSDLNYTVVSICRRDTTDNSTTSTQAEAFIQKISGSSIKIKTNASVTFPFMWYACGYTTTN